VLAPFGSKEIALSKFSLCLVVYSQHQRVFNSNKLGDCLGFYIPSGKGILALPWGDVSCCLVVAVLVFTQWQKLSGSANELRLQNFLTMWIKEL
jgi:hypothetical protein